MCSKIFLHKHCRESKHIMARKILNIYGQVTKEIIALLSISIESMQS